VRLTGKHPFNCEPPLDLLSAIANILHQQTHDISKPLKLSGYAYSGGGHRVIRPEVPSMAARRSKSPPSPANLRQGMAAPTSGPCGRRRCC